MPSKSLLLFISIISLQLFAQQSKSNISLKLNLTNVEQIVATLTLEEKAAIVAGGRMKSSNDVPDRSTGEKNVSGAASYSAIIPHLGIPAIVLADGPAGVRIDPIRYKDTINSFFATAWPVGALLASSWDVDLVKKVGIAFGNEVKEYGIDVILAPGMNIQRNPLNGRNFEYYSEDPLVSGLMGSALVNGIQSNGVGTSIKHFVANNQETSRMFVNEIISERALREIYLRGFEIVIKKSQPWTVMSSYNKLNGTYTSERFDLLTTILRNEWGFKGFVMSDWFAGRDRVAQMKAGNDIIEPGGASYANKLIEAVKSGELNEKVLDQNTERILNIIVKTPTYKKYNYSDKPDLIAHAVLAREAASESMILLKNSDNVLPLKKKIKIALFGVASYHTIIAGLGSGHVNNEVTISIQDGLSKTGFHLMQGLKSAYTNYLLEDEKANPNSKIMTYGIDRPIPEWAPTMQVIEKNANEADVAIYTIGRKCGEGKDRTVENDFNLSTKEDSLIQNIAIAFHAVGKKLIVVINSGGAIETASWKKYADAILLAWFPGEEAGNAIADIISGKVNPSGKLATTFPMTYEDVPSSKSFPGTPVEKPTEVVYNEGIYVGYRYYNTFGVKTSYSFGFGLSYTTFKYSGLKVSSTTFNDKITAIVTITNTGKVPGKEVAQLYLSAPVKTLDKPKEELKGFAKTQLLKPGESQTLTFQLNSRDLASFNTAQSVWIADAGLYTVKIGTSSEDVKLTKSFKLATDLVVEKVHKALEPQVAINEL